MFRATLVLALSGLMLGGCYIETYENGDGSGSSDWPADSCGPPPKATGCSADSDCKDTERCSSTGSCVPPAATPACAAHEQCSAGSYCNAATSTCTESAPCQKEEDCADGFNCDSALATCLPASEPTCSEQATEADCVSRADCEPVYAGVNCSCGADCTCKGGEPGCVCQSFEFFRCVDLTL